MGTCIRGWWVALVALAVVGCAGQQAPQQQTSATAAQSAKPTDRFFVGAAGVTGVYYPAGGAVCRMFNKGRAANAMKCTVESTAGSIDNINGLRSGDYDYGLVQSDIQFDALNGKDPFAADGAFGDLRSLFSLHAEPFTVVARTSSGIGSFDNLKGKRVNVGNPGSGQRATMELLMAAKGWTMADFAATSELPSAEQGDALAGNRVDAIVLTVGHPSSAIYETTSSTAAMLVPVQGPEVDTLLAETPYFAKSTIPGGFYPGTDNDIPTFGVRATLVTTAAAPDEQVYQMVKSVFQDLGDFMDLHPALANLDPREMAKASLSAPLHPGAERYYREAGLL